jgi:hypothetical protein
MCQINPFQILTFYFFKIPFTVPSIYKKVVQTLLFPSGYPTKIPYAFLFSATHATCTTHCIVVYLAGSNYVTVLLLTLKAIALNDASTAQSPPL